MTTSRLEKAGRGPSVLYVVYWGAAEPLGQSLILPSVKRLCARGVQLTLVTFEKPQDVANAEGIARIGCDLAEYGVQWIPLKYHKGPQTTAKLFDAAHGLVRSLLHRRHRGIDIVHARTFVGGVIGLPVASLLRARLIYHNEGFYADEQVDGGVWAGGSARHRLARALEHHFYARADGIISLSHRARREIQDLPEVRRRRTPVIVVPSTVDLARFRCPEGERPAQGSTLRLAYIGSIGFRYLFHRIVRFVSVAYRELGCVRFSVLTRADRAEVENVLGASGLPRSAWSVDGIPHTAMPQQLVQHDAGLFFLTQGLSEHGCSPTKIGEYWACGLPVVSTPNVSDTDEIIRRDRVGVIVSEHSTTGYREAVRELVALLRDPGLPQRCRRAAEAHYALEPACERQLSLYRELAR